MKSFHLITFIVSVSTAFGAPQFLTQQLGEPVVRLVSRPRAVAHHIAPAAGPFTIRANPPILISQAAENPIPVPARPTIVTSARTSLLPTVPSPNLLPVNGEPSVFQAPDGSVFALSNGVNTIQPGQLFQLSDGRIFTAAVGSSQEPKQESLFDQVEQNDAVIDALRSATDDNNSGPVDVPAPEDNLEVAVEESVANQEEEVEEEALIRTTQTLVPAPAPQLVNVQPLFGRLSGVPSLAAPASAQVVSVQRAPVGFSASDAVSTQYFNYPNFGIAYEF